jgi:CubicO group peptidase (beta-lactamase class C family)
MDPRIEEILQPYQGENPGASLLVIEERESLVRYACGLADLEAQTPVTAATNFRLASVTKGFTAAAILLLAQDRKLSLEDCVRRWLPSLPAVADGITLHQLLAHTSGLIDYEEVTPDTITRALHDADVLRLLESQHRTYFVPGSAYRYSDSAYALAALVVARASGLTFASFLCERIFAPLGMTATVAYEEGRSTLTQRAFGYSVAQERWVRTDQSLTSAVLGDGGVYSSIEDLAKWSVALDEPGLLSAESLALAFTPTTRTDDANLRYGLGWRISGETVWHSGETLGFRNVIVRWPRKRFAVILLTNRNGPEVYTIALKIAKLFIPDADSVRASQVVVGPDSGAHPLPRTT